jgi:acyl-CoA synthetase (AMP-forming)/AMP-acid ligase II
VHTQTATRKSTPAVAESAAQSHTNIGSFIDNRTAKFEWRDAFRDAKANIRWTYKEIGMHITGYAAGFHHAPGGNRGKAMLALTGNSAETFVTLLAASRIGAAYGVLDATIAEEAGPAIDAAKASTLIVPPSFEKELLRLIPEWSHPLFTQGIAAQGPVNSARHRSLRQVSYASPMLFHSPLVFSSGSCFRYVGFGVSRCKKVAHV